MWKADSPSRYPSRGWRVQISTKNLRFCSRLMIERAQAFPFFWGIPAIKEKMEQLCSVQQLWKVSRLICISRGCCNCLAMSRGSRHRIFQLDRTSTNKEKWGKRRGCGTRQLPLLPFLGFVEWDKTKKSPWCPSSLYFSSTWDKATSGP